MTAAMSVIRTSVLLVGLFLQLARSELQLEQVQVLFRHGERTPRAAEMYPNDPHNASAYEPMGLSQLTNKGKMTEFRIGEMLRSRYNDFLGDIYRPEDILAVSSDVDRTKMSLLLTLAGLYPPSKSQTWNSNLSWMPVPISYLPEKLDLLMKPHQNPVYREAQKKVMSSEEVRNKIAAYTDFFKFLSEKTGLDVKETSQVYEVYFLLTSQKTMDLPWPAWVTKEVYNKMIEIVLLDYDFRSYTTELKRLNGGMLIRKFLQNMNLDGEVKKSKKMHLYGGHEVNIAAVAKAHNLSEPKMPDYGSAIIVEKLRDTQNGRIFVRMMYWTGTSEKLITYKLNNCDVVCPVNKYLEIVRNVIPSEDELNKIWSHMTVEYMRKYFEEKL